MKKFIHVVETTKNGNKIDKNVFDSYKAVHKYIRLLPTFEHKISNCLLLSTENFFKK